MDWTGIQEDLRTDRVLEELLYPFGEVSDLFLYLVHVHIAAQFEDKQGLGTVIDDCHLGRAQMKHNRMKVLP